MPPSTFARLLASPRAVPTILIVALILVLPSLGLGLFADDWFQRAQLQGLYQGPHRSVLLDLFVFMPGAGRGNEALFAQGILPWWSNPDIQAGFLRPLSSATHMLDYALWPDLAPLMHLHSLLWWLGGLLAAAWLYRRVHGPGALSSLALLLFAVDDAHAMTIGWVANRNALVSLALGLVALALHRSGRRLPALLALALALLAGESGLGALAYIVAFELLRPGLPRARALALLPYTALLLAWRLVYDHLGYGASGSYLYVDPGRSPGAFLGALAERWPLLTAGQWLGAPVDPWLFLHRPAQLLASGLAALFCLGLLRLLWPLLREEAEARTWALGSTLAVIPLCATFPTDRLLLWPGLGAFPLVALLVQRAGWLDQPLPLGGRRRLAGVLLFLHLPLAALLLPLRLATLPGFGAFFHSGADQAPRDAAVAHQTLVFLSAFELSVAYTGIVRMVNGSVPVPLRLAQVGSVMSDQRLTTLDAHRLLVEVDGGMLASSMDRMFWAPGLRFKEGQRVLTHPDFEVLVLDVTPDGRPTRFELDFHAPLADPSLRFLAFEDGVLQEWTIPPVGESVEVPMSLPRTLPKVLSANAAEL